MNCNHVKSQLSAYIDSELSGAQMLAIRSHLTACNECRKEMSELRAVKTGLSQLVDHLPDATLSQRILAHAIEAQAPARFTRSGVLTLATAATTAAILAFFVFSVSTKGTDKAKMAIDPAGFDSQTDQAVTMPDFGGHAPIVPVSK